jgi:hypothetical protein
MFLLPTKVKTNCLQIQIIYPYILLCSNVCRSILMNPAVDKLRQAVGFGPVEAEGNDYK